MSALRIPIALAATLAAGLALSGCTGKSGPPEGTATPAPSRSPAEEPVRLEDPEADLDGLKFTLSEVPRPAPDGARAPLADASPLDAGLVKKLLARTAPLERAERTDFALRKQSPPPPRPGEEVQEPWPPPAAPDVAPDADPGALTVRRYAPEGEIPMAPHVSVTFSQPMIAVTSQDQARQTVPVTLEPQPEGQWRWLGTRTVLFDPDVRLPMATEFTATIPAGTTSALDVALDEPVSFSFSTPPVGVRSWYPTGPSQSLDTLLVLTFDQRIDAEALLPYLSLDGGGGVELALASEARIDADPRVKRMLESAEEDRYVVLEPKAPLQPATSYTVRLAEGAPSAEGPRPTTRVQSQSFRTYDPLRVEDTGCWEVGGGCNPDGQLWVRLNNGLEPDTAESHIRVSPEIPGLVVDVSGSWVNLRGAFPARTKVEVVLDGALTDIYGQQLGKDWSRTFSIGPARPLLMGPGKEQVVLDPTGPPVLPLYTRNLSELDVQIYKVNPGDLDAMASWAQQNRWRTDDPQPAPIRPVFDGVVPITAPDDVLTESGVSLADHLVDDAGQFFVVASTPRRTRREERARLTVWVQRTRVGVTVMHDAEVLKAWVTDLQTGAPIEGAQVRLLGAQQGAATSDAQGLATLAPYRSTQDVSAVLATVGSDTSVLTSNPGLWLRGGFMGSPTAEHLRWVVFDDRGMYKPGESARFKGFVRPFLARPGKGLGAYYGDREVSWVATDAQGAEIAQGTTPLSEQGGFDLTIEDLGESPNLGMASLSLSTDWRGAESYTHRFQIQEFRRPEFEVTTSVDPRPYVLGQHAIATAEASYYAGGGLPGAPVTWSVVASPGSWRPTGWKDFTFGTWVPWWRHWGGPSGGTTVQNLQSQTGPDGTASVRMDFLAMQPPRATSIRAEATVQDVNRQRWSSASTFLVHPADRYVGLHVERAFIEKGKSLDVRAVVVDLDGEAVAGSAIDLALARLVWKRVGGEWTEVEEPGPTCSLTSAEEPVSCALTPELGGTWRLTADITDDAGRKNRTTRQVWVSGAGSTRPERGVEQQEIVLVPSQESPAVGDTVEILVQAPFWPAEGLVTTRQDGLMSTERITLTGPSTTLQIPIEDRHVPTLHVEVDLVGEAARTDDDGTPLSDAPKRVAYAHGGLSLNIPPLSRTLDVQVDPAAAEVRPGASTHVDVTVTDAEGRPVPDAEVVVWMVDEAVLALSGYQTPDPLAIFYAGRGNGVSAAHLRSRVVLVDPESIRGQLGSNKPADDFDGGVTTRSRRGEVLTKEFLADMPSGRSYQSAVAADGAGAMPPSPPMELEAGLVVDEERSGDRTADTTIEVRTDFRALAIFSPSLSTGARGSVRVPVDLPDSLTRYRVMVVAADAGVRFGSADASLTARQPLMLRPSPPRFLNVGDKAEFPLVVQNPTDRPVTVDLALAVDNAKLLDSLDADVLSAPDRTTGGLTFTVPAEDRREVRLPVGVIDAGTLRFQAVVASNDASDAASDELPVWTPATTEAFATYGSLTEGAMRQPIQAPRDAWSKYGGLQITTSSTQLQALTDALIYLNDYPFVCTEQVSSRVLANAALYPVLDAFAADQLPTAEAMKSGMVEDLELLARRQRGSGGFSYWGRSDDVYPFPSLHAVHALVRARDQGWEGDPQVLARGLQYARTIERHIPAWYSENAKRTIRAYAVYVLHRAGEDRAAQARELARYGTDGLSLEAQAWIVPTLAASGQDASVQTFLRHWDNKAVETAAAATFEASYTDTNDYVLLHGSRRTDAVLLETLLEVHPEHDLNEKVVVGLLGHRRKGRWSSTQENSFVLLALNRYFGVYEDVTPDFVARAWLDDGFAGQHAFEGRTTERSHIDVPMAWLQEGPETRQLVLAKEGEGRLYYRIGLRYAPRDLQLPPADNGFAVERTYEAVDDPDDVRQDPDGTWRIKAGAQVRVRVSMVAESRRTMVALVDPMPGGFEPLNPALAVTGTIPADPEAARSEPYWWWSRPWYNHQNLRDERAEAFTDLLWAGVHEYTYVAVATTPGRFVVPPPKAEEMYHPETFGRGAGARVIIE